MEEPAYTLVWGDETNNLVQNEEVICDMGSECTILDGNQEYTEVCEEVVVDDDEENGSVMEEHDNGVEEGENIMYVTEDDMLVMQEQVEGYDDGNFVELTTEEVVAGPWTESCSEIIVGCEEDINEHNDCDDDIPLPTDQDAYTAARPYPCDFCARRFSKKANLQNHMTCHKNERSHCCNLCGVSYVRKFDLMNHLKTHAFQPDTIEEEIPSELDMDRMNKRGKLFSKKRKHKIKREEEDRGPSVSQSYDYVEEDVRLMETMESGTRSDYSDYQMSQDNDTEMEPRFPVTDSRKPFVCQHCGVGFAREKALASHARCHSSDSPFECRTCEEVFWDLALMQEHIREKHNGIEQDYDDDDEDDDEEYSVATEDDTKFGQFFCPTCGMTFHRQDNLKRHQRVHVKEELSKESGFGLMCNVCGESFPEPLELLAHAEVHARGWEHRCMICGEVFVDDEAVASHVSTRHGKNLPPNTCLMCGRTCKDRRTLLKHSFEHSKEKSFGCTKCDKTFHNKARLKRHMISHRSKVVSCVECGENFPDGRSLMNHRHSHSSASGRHFPCRECGKTFGSRSSQQIHIRIHTGEKPYGCRYCWKAFADGGTLRKHERIHTGEKPYACAVCPRAFNQRVVLREHIRSHHSGPDSSLNHSVTPYSCAVCSDLFATSQDLILHLIHHCDVNTKAKRQPQHGPRKYKRRRKLKPHELEMMSMQNEEDEEMATDSDGEYRKRVPKKSKRTPPKPHAPEETSYAEVYDSFTSAIENINTIMNTSKTSKLKKKAKPNESPVVPSRPKMIHTQKTRVPVDNNDGGKVRHKMKTTITHTQPTELRSATGERMRPRTKNVSYHILQGEKFPLATFPDDTEEAVNNLIASEDLITHEEQVQTNGIIDNPPEIASEQTVETDYPGTASDVSESSSPKKSTYSLRPGRTIIGPGSKVRFLKGGMLVSKNKKIKQEKNDIEEMEEPVMEAFEPVNVKQEYDPSPLHELAELSVQHSQNTYKCEMCSEIFADREQLLVHVPIHI